MSVLSTVLHHITLSSALFLLILLGYLLMRIGKWPKEVVGALSKFVFNIAVPALLFNTMCGGDGLGTGSHKIEAMASDQHLTAVRRP